MSAEERMSQAAGRKRLYAGGLLVAATAAAAAVGGALGDHAAAAALGGGLVLVYWLLDQLFTALGRHGSFAQALGIGLAGMAVRLAVVLGCLVAVGLLDRPGFAACSLAFLAVFTLHLAVSTSVPALRASR